MVEVLLAAGGDLTIRADNGETPLHLAARYNENPAVVEALLAAGANVREDDDSGQTPLHWAAALNPNPAVIEALVAAGANVREDDDDDNTLLHLAAGNNENPAVVEALLAAGANVREDDDSGQTPLHWAAALNPNPAVIEALVAAGANVREDDDDDNTPLHLAAGHNENPAVVEALIAAGANVQEDDDSGHTPLHLAARDNENPAVAEALIAAGANVREGDNADHTPLYYATRNENPAVADALRAGGADRLVSGPGFFDIAGAVLDGVAAGLSGATLPPPIRNTGGTVAPPSSAQPTSAQGQLLSAIRDSIREGMCGDLVASSMSRTLEEYLASMEPAAEIANEIVIFGYYVRFSRLPNNNHPYTIESNDPDLRVAIEKANTFMSYPVPDSIPRFRADVEALLVPDISNITNRASAEDGPGSIVQPTFDALFLTMYGADITVRQAAYCGFDLPNFRAR